MEHDKIRNVRTQLLSQFFQVIAPLREHDRGAPVFKGLDYIFADEIIAGRIGCQHRIELLDGGSIGLLFDRELGRADNDPKIAIGFDGYPTNENTNVTKVIVGADQALRVYKGSPVLKETLAFVNWWYTSDYGKKWFSEIAGVIPPIKNAVAPNFEIIKQGNAHVAAEGAGTLGVVYSTDSFWQAFGELMQSYIAGTGTKDAVIAQIEKKWVELEGKK
jgi:ABC-type glycerol-3-phosphate transport system substrate-binding protein